MSCRRLYSYMQRRTDNNHNCSATLAKNGLRKNNLRASNLQNFPGGAYTLACACVNTHMNRSPPPPISNLFCRHWTTSYQSTYREYGAILVSKFNNILTTCDISFWCTDFQEGYIFWGTNFLQGYIFGVYKFSEVVEISWRGTNFLKGYIFGSINFISQISRSRTYFEGVNFLRGTYNLFGFKVYILRPNTITDLHGTPYHVLIPSKMCFYSFPVTQTRTCRSMMLCSWIVEMGPYCSCVFVAGGVITMQQEWTKPGALCNYQCYALHLLPGHSGERWGFD